MPKDIRAFLDSRLISIAGAVITPGSLLLGGVVAILSIALANVIALYVGRVVVRRGGTPGSRFAIAKMVLYAGTALGVCVHR